MTEPSPDMPDIKMLETAATAYEARLVPALFQPWAERVADAAGFVGDNGSQDQRVLDVACGTGVLTRTIAARLASTGGGTVAGVDRNPGMLAVAARIAPEIAWQEGVAESLPYDDDGFDTVVSQFGLMFFDPPETAVREMARVLKPGGTMVVTVFDGLDGNRAYAALADVYERVVGADVAAMLRFPFSFGDPDRLRGLFADSGLDGASLTSIDVPARFPSVRDMVLADVEGWFPLAGIALDPPTVDEVIDAAAEALAQQIDPDGAVTVPTRAHVIGAGSG